MIEPDEVRQQIGFDQRRTKISNLCGPFSVAMCINWTAGFRTRGDIAQERTPFGTRQQRAQHHDLSTVTAMRALQKSSWADERYTTTMSRVEAVASQLAAVEGAELGQQQEIAPLIQEMTAGVAQYAFTTAIFMTGCDCGPAVQSFEEVSWMDLELDMLG